MQKGAIRNSISSKKWAGIAAAVLAAFLSPALVQAAEDSLETRVDWINRNAVVVRSIDPADEDFSDLMPLVDLIGGARIVQLGEGSHQSGTAFKAKSRLIKFLHQVMGFDVLVWESGMYDCREMNTALRADLPAVEAARLGVFGIWVLEETRELFEYAQASFQSDRPLEMAGFDEQFSSRSAALRFREDLGDFLDAREPGYPDPGVRETFSSLMEKLDARKLDLEGQGRLAEAVDTIEAALQRDGDLLPRYHGRLEIEFFRRALANLKIFSRASAERLDAQAKQEQYAVNDSWNARDRQNADNMLWLVNERFRGRKLIVWAHNGHIMNCVYRPDWRSVSHDIEDAGMVPVGYYLDQALGDEVYTVGFVGYSVVEEDKNEGKPQPRPFPEDALESLCAQTGSPHLFIDFRRLDTVEGHWLRRPFKMGIRSYFAEEMQDVTRVYDAVFYNRVIEPGTRIDLPAKK
jgi:erythromycin esterase